MKPTLEKIEQKAKEILDKKKKEKEYLEICYESKICSICGEIIQNKFIDNPEFVDRYIPPFKIFGITIKEGKIDEQYRKNYKQYPKWICKNNHINEIPDKFYVACYYDKD